MVHSRLRGLTRRLRAWRAQPIVALGLATTIGLTGFVDAACGRQAGPRPDAAATAGSAPPAPAQPPAPPDARTTADAVAMIKTLAADAEPTTFDVDRKAAEIGNDPATLLAYVRDHVRTEIYAGVLRGPRGTLMGGAGNAWDQSLLLAAMLRHHGRETRVARTHLAPDAAQAVVARMFAAAVRPRAPVAKAGAIPASLDAHSRAMVARIQANWQRAHGDVVHAIDGAHLALGETAASAQTLETEAADHAFVQYRDGDRWVSLDPAGAAPVGESVGAATETFAEIPDALFHHVTIHVKVEERRGQALDAKDVLRYVATAASLNGTDVTLSHHVGHEITGRWRAMPVLNVGPQAYGAMAFTEAGVQAVVNTKKDDLIGQAHQAVGQLRSVTDAFGGGSDQPAAATAAAQLSAVYLDVDFSDPSGRTEVVQRDILDRIGVAARHAGTAGTAPLAPIPDIHGIPAALTGVYACAFTTGPLDPLLPVRRLAPHAGAVAAAPASATVQQAQTIAALPGMLWTSAAAVHVLSQQLARGIRATSGRPLLFYEASPRLAIASVDVLPAVNGGAPTLSTAIDLRRNGMRAVGADATAKELVQANLARGVLDGAIEDGVAAQLVRQSGAAVLSTVSILSGAAPGPTPLAATKEVSAIGTLSDVDVVRARMDSDVRDAKVVVARQKPSSPGRTAWWTVDLATGETVGVLDNGLRGGQPLAEDTALAQTVDMPAARMLAGVDPLGATQAVQAAAASGISPMGAMALGFGLGIFVAGAAIFAAAMTWQNR
jgi:transglutaminase-like putative cysteine protease